MSTKAEQPITIIQDTWEKAPLDFAHLPGVTVECRHLETGDYSLDGHVREICIERKSADDLVGTMMNAYVSMSRRDWYMGRFNRELFRMTRYRTAWLVVECPRGSILAHAYRSECPPASVIAWVRSLQVHWGVHVYWADNRLDAATEIVAICRAYLSELREIKRRVKREKPVQRLPSMPHV